MSAATSRPAPPSRLRYLAIACVVYVPLLVARPGLVGADTKQYLYLDPGGLMRRALSLWDPTMGGGTVTHQTIGYLWPMGPYYWVMETAGVPDWVAQRLWIGSVVAVAAAGALALLDRVLKPSWLNLVGALAYGISPYILGHATGQSAILLPYVALPWLVLALGRATLAGGWRWPAVYALVITTCGSLNGSSIFFVVLGSVLWAPFLVRSHEDIGVRDAAAAVARCGVLTLVTQLWWIVGYLVGGSEGMPILAMTETLETTSATSAATEVIRGLGYWFFYGRDKGGLWLDGIAEWHTTRLVPLAASFVLPVVALALGGLLRWRHRAYFAALVLVGMVVGVGAFGTDRSPYGALFAVASERSDLVFSLRNSQRATPLVVLGLAGLLVAGLHAIATSRPALARRGGAVVLVMALVAFPTFWTTSLVADRFHRDDQLPDHTLSAADHLRQGEGRVLLLPGIDFGAYRWGNTLDPVLPGLVDRPMIWRELIPWGTPAGVDLLVALDRSIQEGTFEPQALAPVARLLGANDVVVRGDLEYERYRTVRPRVLWDALTPTPPGLGEPTTFGEGTPNVASEATPMIDEVELAIDPEVPEAPAIAVFPVEDPPDLVRAVPASGGVIVAGSGEGVVALAAAGLLEPDAGPIRYAAEVTMEPTDLERALTPSTRLVMTDSNRWRGHQWYSLRENVGMTETRATRDEPSPAGDARVPPVPDQLDRSMSYAEHRGAARIWATTYGNPTTLITEARPVLAFDGDPRTSWTTDPIQSGDRQTIGIELAEPVDAEWVVIRQPVDRPGFGPIERAEIRLDGDRTLPLDLDERSLTSAGQRVELDGQPFTELEVRILDADDHSGLMGLSSVDIPGVEVEEIIHLPTDIPETLGGRMADHPLDIVLTRHRVAPTEVVRMDPELSLARSVPLAAPVEVDLTGTARLSAMAPGALLDRLVGISPAEDGGVTVSASATIGGDLTSRPSAILDGDRTTAWRSTFASPPGTWVEVVSATPFTMDTLRLDLLADGRHSVPRSALVEVDGQTVEVDLPAVADADEPGATTRLEVPLGAEMSGTRLRVTFLDVDERLTTDWYSLGEIALPIGVAELHVPDVTLPAPAVELDDRCRDDLVSVDGRPVPVRVSGTVADALARQALDIEACAGPVPLGDGDVVVRSESGASTGIDVDRLVLRSDAAAASAGTTPTPAEVEWSRPSRTDIDVTATPHGDDPFWIVVSESWSGGWRATADGVDLGPPELHDAFGMGWYVDPDGPGPITLSLTWEPQRAVHAGLVASLLGALACIVLVLRHRGTSAPDLSAAPALDLGQGSAPGRGAVALALVIGTFVVAPLHGAVAALVVLAARIEPRARRVVRLLPAALVAVAAAYVVVLQLRWGYRLDFFWPRHFTRVHRIVLLAPVVLAALAWSRDPSPGHDDPRPVEP